MEVIREWTSRHTHWYSLNCSGLTSGSALRSWTNRAVLSDYYKLGVQFDLRYLVSLSTPPHVMHGLVSLIWCLAAAKCQPYEKQGPREVRRRRDVLRVVSASNDAFRRRFTACGVCWTSNHEVLLLVRERRHRRCAPLSREGLEPG